MLVGSIELGGTNCNCAVGLQDGTILKKVRFPTEAPEITVENIVRFFRENEVAAIGIGCFGPVNVDETSPGYGMLLDTPKKSWVNFPLLQSLHEQLKLPIRLHTDVTVSCLGEVHVSKNEGTVLYITIGTGVGGGVVLNGKIPSSPLHSEMGHVTMQRVEGDEMESACPFHPNCFEGLASGTAINKRWAPEKANELPGEHPAWEMEADYIAQGLCQLIFTLAPSQIIIGGGVMNQKSLLPLIHRKVKEKLGGYYFYDALKDMDELIILPRLGEDSALVGGLLMSNESYARNE